MDGWMLFVPAKALLESLTGIAQEKKESKVKEQQLKKKATRRERKEMSDNDILTYTKPLLVVLSPSAIQGK